MRIIKILLLVAMVHNTICAQDTIQSHSVKRINSPASFSFGVSGYETFFSKNQLAADAYNLRSGVQFEYRMGVKDFFGFGIFANKATSTIDDPSFLTNFSTVRFREKGIFGYYLHPVGKRVQLEAQVGYGGLSIKHFDTYEYFKLKYDGFFTGIGLQSTINPKKSLVLYGQVQHFWYSGNNIQINDADRNYIIRANKIAVHLGLRFQLFERQ